MKTVKSLKWLSLLLVLALGIPGSALAYTDRNLEAPRAENVVIDGDLSEWDLTRCLTIDSEAQIIDQIEHWDGVEDCSMEIYAMWDEENLYIGARVKDDTPFVYREGFPLDELDAIILFLSTNPEADPDRTAYEATDWRIVQSTDEYDFFNFVDRSMVADDQGYATQGEYGDELVFDDYEAATVRDKEYPNMTVRENMSFALKTKKAPKEEIQRRVDYMARMLSIEQLLDRRPAELSGGQRQRVALGRALVRDPQVFLLDEPLGNLDAKLRDQVRYELKKIQLQLGITTIYVTHDQTEAMTMADRIVLLKDGRIMQQGTPDDLYDHPANEFVAGFLGTPQINLFSCTVRRGDGGALTLDAGDFCLAVPDALKASLEGYVDRKVDLGVRPSDFELAAGGENAIHAHVDSIEPLGDAYLIYVRVGEKVVVFKYTGEQKPTEKELSLVPNLAKLHLFDPETQNRINA